jgi:hypothetical protein
MKPEERHRLWITAVAEGDTETAQALRLGIGDHGERTAAMYLRGVTTICLHHRLGAPSCGEGIDHDLLARLVTEMQAAQRKRRLTVPIPGFLYVEGAVRALYGEAHLFVELGPTTTDAALTAVLRHLYVTEPGIRTRFARVVAEAQQMMIGWMLD